MTPTGTITPDGALHVLTGAYALCGVGRCAYSGPGSHPCTHCARILANRQRRHPQVVR